MAASANGQICWFCGSFSSQTRSGWSLPVFISSDYRLENPQVGEFATELGLGVGSDPARICSPCILSYYAQCHCLLDAYLHDQRQNGEEMSCIEADIATGLQEVGARGLHYGCWFGSYPLLPTSRRFFGLSVLELYRARVDVIRTPFVTTRNELERAIGLLGESVAAISGSVEECRTCLSKISLADDELQENDYLRLCGSRVSILDATLVLDFASETPLLENSMTNEENILRGHRHWLWSRFKSFWTPGAR